MIPEGAEPLSSSGEDDWPDTSRTLESLLSDRFSCRSYRPEPVPHPVIERMLAVAQRSASWCNTQPWRTIVTEGAGTERLRTALYELAGERLVAADGSTMQPDFPFPAAYTGVYKERQREVGWQLYESVGIAYGDRVASKKQVLENFRLFGAPHVLVVTSERDLGTYGAIDCGLYMGALLLSAQSLGIGMVPQAALASYAPFIRRHFGLPENRVVVFGASFGYPDTSHPANSFRSGRAKLEDVVQWVDD